MDGAGRRAGASTGTRCVRNPILLARQVMEAGRHVCLAGQGAEAFAREAGLALVDPGLFITPRRVEALRRIMQGAAAIGPVVDEQDRHGTVGAVALDGRGHLAAATSTGGRAGKAPGRVGDSPVPGAGTYAQDGVVAVSGTGAGEYFLRSVAAHRVAALIELAGLDVAAAAARALNEMRDLGGSGGMIALDAQGRFAMPFTGRGMYRGMIGADGRAVVDID
jgi:beta-aspartyl-peptidase (threonine type)